MSVFLDNERPLVTLAVRWGRLKPPKSDTEGWRGKARRRSTSHLPVEHTRRHLDTLTNSADKQSCDQTLQIDVSGTHIFIRKKKQKKTGCLSWKTAEVIQKCSLLLAIAGLITHPKCCFLLFIFICKRTIVWWAEPGTQKPHTRSDGAFFVQRVGSHLHVSLRSPPPTRRELGRRAQGVRSTCGVHNQNGGENHTGTCPSQHCYLRSIAACRQPKGAAGCQTSQIMEFAQQITY